MLTGFQCETIAYASENGEIVCVECAERDAEDRGAGELVDVDSLFIHHYGVLDPETSRYAPCIRYSLEESYPEGLSCGDCGKEIIEPAEDLCTYHGAWRRERYPRPTARSCEEADSLEEAHNCSFPDADLNPPRSRWTPCSVCGARDGERCDLSKHTQPNMEQGGF